MLTIPGFSIAEELKKDAHIAVYRGVQTKNNKNVIIKALFEEYPSLEVTARLRHEYELLRKLSITGVPQVHDFIYFGNKAAIILEDVGGITLKQLLNERPMTIKNFLPLAIELTGILGELHQQGIIHKDIKLANIQINPTNHRVAIIDFGVATQLSKETQFVMTPELLGGTLAYMSPEQTGRMGSSLDYRSDFYSLGVTFYEMLTGQLPFKAEDSLGLIYAHIAIPPPSPASIVVIPQVIAEIILKLLAKTPEQRYQSAYGLINDLKKCLDEFSRRTKIELFALGTKDIPLRFEPSGKLYGREQEIAELHAQYNQASFGKLSVLQVIGYAGVGKTSLVTQLQKKIVENQGYFCNGKYDQLQREDPYQGWIKALRYLIHQILTENETALAIWKQELVDALGNNAQVMIELIPELELIIGKQPDIAALTPIEVENRFYSVFENFLNVLAQKKHPLIIFLDDLQWAGLQSLKLLQRIILQFNVKYLFIIISYRTNEVDKKSPLTLTFEEIKKSGGAINTIELKPLSRENVTELIIDSTHSSREEAHPLSELCYEKTEGNPFFINQFLQTLYTEKLLSFNPSARQWQWDIAKIKKMPVSSNVIDLMIINLKKLEPQTQQLLELAACIGSQFDLKTLAIVNEKNSIETADILWPALQAGYIVPMDEAYKYTNEILDISVNYRFLHDRVQQAAYQMIPEDEKNKIHYKIGKLLLRFTPEKELENNLFQISNQLNLGINLTTLEEKDQLFYLNFQAGKKAKKSAAFQMSNHYFNIALSLLKKEYWQTDYPAVLSLYIDAAETSYVVGDYVKLELFTEEILINAKAILEKIKGYEIRISAYTFKGEIIKAINTGLDVLKSLKVTIPKNPTKTSILKEFVKLKIFLMGKDISKLSALPEMQDPYQLAAMQILSRIILTSYITQPFMTLLVCIKMVMLSIKYGNSVFSANGYAGCLILLWLRNDTKTGKQFGELVLQLCDRYNDKKINNLAYFNVVTMLYPWIYPLEQSKPLLLEAYKSGIDVGEVDFAWLSVLWYCTIIFWTERTLDEVIHELKSYLTAAKKLKLNVSTYDLSQILQCLIALKKPIPITPYIKGEYFDEEKMLPMYQKSEMVFITTVMQFSKMLASYLLDDFENALIYCNKADPNNFMGLYTFAVLNFYYALINLTVFDNFTTVEKRVVLKKIKKIQNKMKGWAENSPHNFLHKYYLIEAETARVMGDIANASQYYDKAIEFAEGSGFVHELAIVNEVAARFYLAINRQKLARVYMSDAYYIYMKWGATEKLKHLEKKYPDLLLQKTSDNNEISTIMDTTTTGFSIRKISDPLDFSSIMKASQAISGEIVLNKLITQLLQIMAENVGAERCVLLLTHDSSLLVEGEYTSKSGAFNILNSIQLTEYQAVPITLIQYVNRTKQPLIIDNATGENKFLTDNYFSTVDTRSVLCLPIMHKNEIFGVLYFENNLVAGAFNSERINIVKTLSSQAAISIENARLYQAFERFVPKEFLALLKKRSLIDIQPGDYIDRVISVLFVDIKGFTSIAEQMSPAAIFKVINAYLQHMEPIIATNNGFIDKYMGDGFMALFPQTAEDALAAAIAMQQALVLFNNEQPITDQTLKTRTGINTGPAMLGTIGSQHRIDGSVMGDTINSASRITELNRVYDTDILIGEDTYVTLKSPEIYPLRIIDKIKLRGKVKPIFIWELIIASETEDKKNKIAIIETFNLAFDAYQKKEFVTAIKLVKDCLIKCPNDRPSLILLDNCENFIRNGCPEDWDGTA